MSGECDSIIQALTLIGVGILLIIEGCKGSGKDD